jgi:hypothetical protein
LILISLERELMRSVRLGEEQCWLDFLLVIVGRDEKNGIQASDLISVAEAGTLR